MSQQSSDGDVGLGFEVVVEQHGSMAAFDLPDEWSYEEHQVSDVKVQVLSPSRSGTRAFGIPIITFHDIAMNAPLCFSTFYSYCRSSGVCPELDTSYAHYHLTAPGHMPDAPELGASSSVEVADLAKVVGSVIKKFKLQRAIGFGFGIGATVLAHAAMAHPKEILGLVLVSPLFYAASFVEKTLVSVDALYTKGIGLGRRAKDRFLERWLSQETRDANFDLTQAIEDELDRLSTPNMVRFITAEVRRQDISSKLNKLKAKVLLITGRESPLRFHTEEAFPSFNPEKVTWLDIPDMGSLVLEEAPDKVARGLSLFLQGFAEYTA